MRTLANEDESNIATRMDRLPVTALHCLAVALCALGLSFDTLEIALGSILAAVFSAPPHLAPARQLSVLLGAIYAGAVIGAPLMGWWADRHGRRRTLTVLLLWMGLTSLAAAAARDLPALSWMRALSGLALGAYPPVMIAYLTDLMPPLRRGLMIFVGSAIATLGPPAAIFLVRWLTPMQPLGVEAWRWGFVCGGIGAGVVGVLTLALPESPRWLQLKGRAAEASAAFGSFDRSRTVLDVRVDPPHEPHRGGVDEPLEDSSASSRRSWPQVAALYFLSPWSTVAFPLLSGAVLAQKGFKLPDTLLYIGLSTFGPTIGTALAATAVDRVDRRVALMACAAAMLGCGAAFVATDSPLWLVAAATVFSLFLSLYIPVLSVYSAELFPTRVRASALAGAWALNRLGAALAPLFLLPLLRNAGASAMFAVIAVALLVGLLVVALAPKGRQRRSID
jgi:putative MFS transporter